MSNLSLRDRAIAVAKQYLPSGVRDWVVRQQKRFHLQWPPTGTVRFGSFRRLTPISPIFALDRGQPIERYYIDKFLEFHSDDIKGHALELGDDTYIRRFGGNRVTRTDVLGVVDGEGITIVADLSNADHIPTDSFDCIIFTQSLQMIYDMKAALRSLNRILKPGGVLLLTSHGISKIGRRLGKDDWGEYWHLTSQSLEKLLDETFPNADISLDSYGNVLTAMCALYGLAAEELSSKELDHQDVDFGVILTARVSKTLDTPE